MPDTLPGRTKIREYMEEHNISLTGLSTMFGVKKQDLVDYLNGKNTSPKANATLIAIIEHFKIR
ncbi:helix-turn-helix domain-containing protein [Vagococcus xieshaowenii]|uniref:XRE family transcriptional regulator n=1 Tax=Vagococcus xieshaowenii TaxID=2562451 RepID=A0AAJ5EG91_9ENTE|nr:helix-turn-helix transcriptional regulator [Vagococcus xieshaowenii]QCA28226.1 XRE family transcriptional regulator [Vagococcus xieshaowenii]TFZ41881.1 XRE family transcriptional regulator [Vagococcus xieshaowenii]